MAVIVVRLDLCRSVGSEFTICFGCNRQPRNEYTLKLFGEPITIGFENLKSKVSLRGCSSMAERQLPKLHTGVRFPSPAHFKGKLRCQTPSGHNTLVTTCDRRLRRCWQCDRNARSPAGVCRLVDSNVASEKGAAGGIAVT